MTMRKFTLSLCILLPFASGDALAQEWIFLKPKQVELLKIVPPPPPLNSEAQKEDMDAVLEVQKKRTPAGVKRAMADSSEFNVQALRSPIISRPTVEICKLILTVSGEIWATRSTK